MSQKFFRPMILMLFSPFLLTCNSANSNQGFGFTVGQNQVVLLNAPQSSCSSIVQGTPDNGVAAVSFSMNTLTVNWSKLQYPLQIEYVEFIIQDPNVNNGSKYTCTIASTELVASWVYNWGVVTSSGVGLGCVYPSYVIFGGTSNPSPPATPPTTPPATVGAACTATSYQSFCPFSCGGITMTNPGQASSGQVLIKIYAIYNTGSGNVVPVEQQKVVTYYWSGI